MAHIKYLCFNKSSEFYIWQTELCMISPANYVLKYSCHWLLHCWRIESLDTFTLELDSYWDVAWPVTIFTTGTVKMHAIPITARPSGSFLALCSSAVAPTPIPERRLKGTPRTHELQVHCKRKPRQWAVTGPDTVTSSHRTHLRLPTTRAIMLSRVATVSSSLGSAVVAKQAFRECFKSQGFLSEEMS